MRIRELSGGLLGAGILLGDRHVLTCAHVLTDGGSGTGARGRFAVDLVGRPGWPPVPATIVPGCWIPPADDGRGDIALLLLDPSAALPAGLSGARLRALSLSWQRAVYTFGFPAGLAHGVYVRAVLAGQAGPGREWVQMNGRDSRSPIRAGFSGSGVVDEQTGDVLGMVVSAWTDPRAGLSWMIPAETIRGYLPRVGEWMTGESSADLSFLVPAPERGDAETDHRTAGSIAEFFARIRPDNVLILVTGPPAAPGASALRAAVRLAHRSRSAGVSPASTAGSGPPVGSIDLAIDATGCTPDDVVRRIVGWAGTARPEPADHTDVADLMADVAPRTLVISGIDESTDPRRLVAEVIGAIVGRATDRDMRLLLGFRDLSVDLRLELLALRIEELRTVEDAAEALYRVAAGVLADPPPVRPHAVDLRLRLTALREVARQAEAAGAPGPDDGPDEGAGGVDEAAERIAGRLAAHERVADRALRVATAVRAELEGALARHRELLGRLTSERALSIQDGLVEDVVLGQLYRTAHGQLTSGRCDLAEAARAVDRFVDERRGRGVAGPEAGR